MALSSGAWIRSSTGPKRPLLARNFGIFLVDGKNGCVYARTGSHLTNDLFHYIFQFDYIDDNVIDKTLNLGEQGLTFEHYYSIGNPKYNVIDALSAKVSIRLDPKNNTFKGHFEATFGSNVKSPNGEFDLTRQPV